VLTSIQAKLDQVIVGQGALWNEVGTVRRELGKVAIVAAMSKDIVTNIANQSLEEDVERRKFVSKIEEMSEVLKCPQEHCLVWRMVGKAVAGHGETPGE
jgi:hypothetical protein